MFAMELSVDTECITHDNNYINAMVLSLSIYNSQYLEHNWIYFGVERCITFYC